MALCLAESLLEKQGSDPEDQIQRYLRWYEDGHLSSTGRCFDIGGTTVTALLTFKSTGQPFSGTTGERTAGNGSIMRLAPVPMFYYPDNENALRHAVESSRTTHGAVECLEACRLLAEVILRALEGRSIEECLTGHDASGFTSPGIASIARCEYQEKPAEEIKGSGYVVESLEAALWCLGHTGSFEGAILAAANLGDDADTTAAVCGQVAGAFYGESGIPKRWLEKLAMRGFITETADRLREANRAG